MCTMFDGTKCVYCSVGHTISMTANTLQKPSRIKLKLLVKEGIMLPCSIIKCSMLNARNDCSYRSSFVLLNVGRRRTRYETQNIPMTRREAHNLKNKTSKLQVCCNRIVAQRNVDIGCTGRTVQIHRTLVLPDSFEIQILSSLSSANTPPLPGIALTKAETTSPSLWDIEARPPLLFSILAVSGSLELGYAICLDSFFLCIGAIFDCFK